MSVERTAAWWLRADAAMSTVLALPGLVDPAGVAVFFGFEDPTCSFLVRLWSALALVFGWMSWDAGREPAIRRTLLDYVWVEKALVALTLLAGHLGGEVPPGLMGLVMMANLPWIVAILYLRFVLRRLAAQAGRS